MMASASLADRDGLRTMFEPHFDFVWRTLRRPGSSDHRVDELRVPRLRQLIPVEASS